MRKILLTLVTIIVTFSVNAQSKKKQDRQAIKEMCGCFEVTFNFTETFNYSDDPNYKPSENKVSKGLEWAELVTDEKDKISIQHLLIVGPPNKQSIVKHWRQDWLYENTDFYLFNGNNAWNFEQKSKSDIKKQWTQKVYQVDDSPRYEGSGSWVHIDGKSYWENTTTAPLPRREYSKRNDYNVTLRGNRHEITAYGWVHDQDNDKIIREAGKEDVVLAKEKGYNTYVKVDDSKCKAAQEWWTKNEESWAKVREQWSKIFAKNQDLHLETQVAGKPLFRHLFDKEFEFSSEKVEQTLESFVIQK